MVAVVGVSACGAGEGRTSPVPPPSNNVGLASPKAEPTAVFAGGCFWGIQAVFQHVKGVINATSGYSGGSETTAEYELVITGETGDAESVKPTYDASQITHGQLLRVFFCPESLRSS